MPESEDIKEVVNHVAVQAVMAVIVVLRETEAGPWPTTAVSHREPQRQMHSGLIIVKLVSNWVTQDRYIELMNFKMEVLKFLGTNAYELSEDEKCRTAKDLFTVLCSKLGYDIIGL